MLLMFVLGAGSIGWMLALGAVMAAEKNLPGGRTVDRSRRRHCMTNSGNHSSRIAARYSASLIRANP
jgi:predicted metal-binding membrane protein